MRRRSFGLGVGVGVASECAVGDIGAEVVHVRHNWLVHGAIPLDEARSAPSVAVDSTMVLMEDRLLGQSPVEMRVRFDRVFSHNAGLNPPEEIWLVQKTLDVELVVVHEPRSSVDYSSTDTFNEEPVHDHVANRETSVDVLDWHLSDNKQANSTSHVKAICFLYVIPFGSVNRAENVIHVTLWEPRSQHCEVFIGLFCERKVPLNQTVFGDTVTNLFVVFNVASRLHVNLASLQIIIGILNSK